MFCLPNFNKIIWMVNGMYGRKFSLRHCAQINTGAYSASRPIGSGVLCTGVKGLEVDHWPSSNAKIKKAWSFTFLSLWVFMAWCLDPGTAYSLYLHWTRHPGVYLLTLINNSSKLNKISLLRQTDNVAFVCLVKCLAKPVWKLFNVSFSVSC